MRAAYWLIGAYLAAMATAVPAATLDLVVVDQRGQPVADAVFTAVPATPEGADATPGPAETRTIDQRNLTFLPYVRIFRPGDSVVFRNSDTTRHHVYSFSSIRAFEFVLAPGETSAPQRLDQPGVVAIGCNIHDPMVAYLYVTSAPWAQLSDANGRARLRDLPAGRYEIHVWQPRLRPGRPDLVRRVVEVRDAVSELTFQLTLLPDPRRQFDRERTQY
jgi:plastocyanin